MVGRQRGRNAIHVRCTERAPTRPRELPEVGLILSAIGAVHSFGANMKTLAVISAVMLAACGAAPPASDALPTGAPQREAAALAVHSLSVNSLPAMRLLATPAGRNVLSRVVSCALPRGAKITAITSSGTPYSFAGHAGLAPAWAQRPATTGERHRVTACVLGQPIETAPPAVATPASTMRA